MRFFNFFSYKINRKILFAFILIIVIPGFVSFWVTSFVVQRTHQKEIESHLREASSVYFDELDMIEQKCIDIAAAFSKKDTVVKQIINQQYSNLEKEMINFYSMNLVDIIEIENQRGKVIFRGHNPDVSGDIKIDQNVVKEGLSGEKSISYEHGHSGFAIRAVAPVFNGHKVIGLFMAGSLFSEKFVQRMKSLTLLDNGIYRGNSKLISTYNGMENLDGKIVQKLKTGQSIIAMNKSLGSGLFHIIIKPIFLKGKYWGAVLLGVNKHEIEKTYSYAHNQLSFVILFGFFVAILIYYFLARNINRSVSRIITGISGFSFDQPNIPIQTDRGDEFGMIADNYNLLIERLELYNQRIRRLQNDLVESTRLATSGQMAANLAHEIRNPLSSIKMMAQIIKTRFLNTKNGTEEMGIILEEIDRINSKVNELLEFARPGKMEYMSCDIHTIIDGVINLCIYMIKEREIILLREYDNKIPEIFADMEKLRMCFLNIILNAVQVMENGERIRISTKFEDKYVEINICNSGSSIDLKNADTLFEPFYTTREGGTGLGLAISKIIIERHKGSISIKENNDMICFCIKIPVENEKEKISYGFNSNY